MLLLSVMQLAHLRQWYVRTHFMYLGQFLNCRELCLVPEELQPLPKVVLVDHDYTENFDIVSTSSMVLAWKS